MPAVLMNRAANLIAANLFAASLFATCLYALLCALAPAAVGASQSDQPQLNAALEVVRSQPAARIATALAADVSQEGHWTFANARGERFTTASPEELKRVLATLAPDAAKPGAKLLLVVTTDTVFRHRALFMALPLAAAATTDAVLALDAEQYALIRSGQQLYAALRPGLAVELTTRALFDETAWQLAHPLKRNTIRILGVEPGGPATILASPRLDPQTKRPLTDQIAPASLVDALRSLRAQTVILTARRDGNVLAFRPSSGPEVTLAAADVLAAAEASDVNLVILQSATPRQPGTRSWLWQRVSVSRLEDAIARDHLADFLNAMATPEARVLVQASTSETGRVSLTATAARSDGSLRSGIGGTLSDMVSNIAGQVVVSGIEANMRGRNRQSELDRRLLAGVPSWLQYGYVGLVLLGLAGHAIASTWWARIWPPEARAAYANAFGYHSARLLRLAAYVVLFLPLTAMASAPMTVASKLCSKPTSKLETA